MHPHYVFWFVAPAALVAAWYAIPQLTRTRFLLAALLVYALVFLPGADYSARPGLGDLPGAVLVTVFPFLGVLALALGGWTALRSRYRWLPLVAFPAAFYLGFTLGATLGMATGFARP